MNHVAIDLLCFRRQLSPLSTLPVARNVCRAFVVGRALASRCKSGAECFECLRRLRGRLAKTSPHLHVTRAQAGLALGPLSLPLPLSSVLHCASAHAGMRLEAVKTPILLHQRHFPWRSAGPRRGRATSVRTWRVSSGAPPAHRSEQRVGLLLMTVLHGGDVSNTCIRLYQTRV